MFGGADPWVDQLVPSDITIRGNHIARPVAWKAPILEPPAGVRVLPASGASGTVPAGLAAGLYLYSVAAERPASGSAAVSAASAPINIDVQSGAVLIEWTPVPGAAGYRVYRTGPGGAMFWRTAAARFTDSGTAGTSGEAAKRASVWTVKNLLELKNAKGVVIEGNLFEHHWPQAQPGHAIVFTPRNQSGRAPWSRVTDVRFANNVVRHVSAGINLSGTDDTRPSVRADGIVIENNLFVDVGGERWGGSGDFVQIGNGPANVRIERNTVLQSGRPLLVYGSRHGSDVPGFVFRNNIVRHNRYGVFGQSAGTGRPAIAKYFPGGIIEGNVFSGGRAADYPDSNRFVAEGELDAIDGEGRLTLKDAARFKGQGADLESLRTSGGAAPAPRPRSKE